MKKKLLWALTLVLLALFPYQNAKASLVQLDRSGWTASASSEHANDASEGMARYAFDGNLGTWWHNEYNGANADTDVPHWIMFNLGSIQSFDAFNYVSRTADPNGCNGNINNYTLYVSDTEPNTSNISGTMTEVTSGTFNYNAQEHKIDLGTTVSGQYVLLYASTTLGTAGANLHANCAEFYLYKNDYFTDFGTSTRTLDDRKLVSINFNDADNTNTAIAVNQPSASGAQIYFDKTSNVITLTKGADVTPTIDWSGWKMHGYLYVDFNGDKTFTPNLGANGIPAENSELIAYTYYNGYDHTGTSTTTDADPKPGTMKVFTIPESIPNGTYRARYTVMWDKIDADATSDKENGMCVVDFTIKVEDSTPTNEKKQNLFSSANISQANQIYPYRIPGIAKAYNNHLIAVAAHLICGTDPGYGQVDLVCRVSKDNGVTWGEEKNVAVGDASLINANTNVFEIAFGDPAIVADRTSNKVAIFVVAGCTHYFAATRSNPNMIGVIYGTYNETTGNWDWEEPKNITEKIYSLYDNVNTVQSAFIAGGKVFQSRIVKVGQYYRLYAAMCARPNGNRVIYSDDFGETWHALGGASAVLTPENGNEPKCEELPDGRVILSSRNANGNGRIYNIYTYTNTTTGEGSWSSSATSTFDGSNQAPGSNNTNGEILIVPVKRNSDSKEMYLALQSQPTGNSRVNVGIYYKELTNLDDMNTVANFATGWNGFYQVSTTESAYSSMDLQADGKVGFIYEEDLTSDGTVQNPITTSFPSGVDPWGSSTHGFEGYNNIYRAYTIEQLTNNAYSLKTDVNRGTFVKTYLTAAVNASTLPTATKTELTTKINALGDNPTTAQVDAIYAELNKDPFDGKIVTFTNVQQNGDKRALYVNGSDVLSLGTTSQTAESLGTSAQFLCEKLSNGKYTFKNIATNDYMIYRNQDSPNDATAKGTNDNKGTLSTYDATYCDWTLGDGSGTVAGTYYISTGRPSSTSPTSCLIVLSSGLFDGWARHEVAYTATYSNLYEIGIVSVPTEELLSDAQTLINKTGVGYPKANSTARTTLQSAIDAAKANSNAVNGMALQNAIDAYYASTDVEMPAAGNLYSFIVGHGNSKYYIYNNNGTLAIASYTEGTTVLPATAKFTCEVNGNYYMFKTSDNKYMAFPPFGTGNYSDASPDGIEDVASDKTKFSIAKLYNNINANVTVSNQDLFGNVYLTVLLRGHKNDGGDAEAGVIVVKTTTGEWDGAKIPYDNGTFSSAISVIPQEIDERTIAVAVSSSDTEKGEVAIEGTDEKTITTSEIVTIKATANEGYKFVKWTVGDVEVSTDATYNDATSGNKTYTAHFAPLTATDKYALIQKPQYSTVGNVNYITSAEISENSVGVAPGVIDLSEIPSVTGSGYTRQRGVTDVIEAEAGADIYLTLTIATHWGGMKFYQLNKGNEEKKVYGQYGPIGAANATKFWSDIETASQADNGIIVEKDQNKVSFRFTFAKEDVQEGDIVIIRAMSANSEVTSPNSSTLTEGTYIDFLFEIKGEAVPHTVKVVVAPSEGGSATINGEDRTQIEASGIVSLSATPNGGYRFLSWTDNNGNLISENADLTKPIVADTTYRANFVKVWSVTATSNNQECGTVTIDGKNSEGSVDHATTITLTAEPTTSGKFIHWTLNDEPISIQNPFKTTILKDEVYQAVFEEDYPAVKLKYTGNETQINRYLKSLTVEAGDISTTVFNADSETSLPRIDPEYTAFGNSGSSTETPTTMGALIDKTANTIKVLSGTTTLDLTFKQWSSDMSHEAVSGAEPQLKWTQQAIFVDWNNDKDFADSGESYGKSGNEESNGTFASADGYTRTITIPNNIQPGVYRMRVVYHEPVGAYTTDWTSDFTEAASANIVTNGRVYDFAIEIVADENYITFTSHGGTYFEMGETVDITLSYPVEGTKIYYTTNGFEPDENSTVIDNGGKVALNTFNEGVVTIKAKAYNPTTSLFCSSVYSASYNISSHYSLGEVPITTYNANTTTIVGAAISKGVGVENGTINHNFVQGQRTATTPISVAGDATFNLDVTFNLKWYGFKIYRINYTGEEIQRSIVSNYIGSNANEVNAAEFESDLTTAGYKFTKDGDQYTVSIPITIKNGENELGEGTNVVYRFIVTGGTYPEITIAPSGSYGDGEYVDFMFTVQPQSSITKLAGTATKDLNITVKTTDACYLQVGGYSQNLPTAQVLTIPASLNAAGEMEIQVVGAEIEKMDIEVLEIGTNVLLPDVDYLGEVTLKSSADFSATTISHASVLPEDGINVVVEKEIKVPYEIDGKMPTYFNFLSMPFDFDPGVNIEFYNTNTGNWEPATLEEDIRVLTYNSATRANGQAYYDYTWNTIGGTGVLIYANHGFVLVGNSAYGDANHKMKVRFKSFYVEQAQQGQEEVTRETIYTQDGSAKTITATRYRNTRGETHPLDEDWQHVGSPYLTHSDGIDYVLYYHDGYKYVSVGQTESPTISAFQSVMFQANLGGLPEQEIIMTPLSIGAKTNAANGVYGRANLAINDDECVKIVLKDDASENFVVNEDAWYMAPTANVFSTMSVNVAGSEASISVQPEPTELPLTVYAGSKAQQTISLSRYDGEVNIFLKDAVTDETVCLNDEDYTFTATPYSTIANRFTVSMIEPTGITESVAEATIKAVVTADGIKLFGTEEGEEVALYTANGMMITNAVAQDGVTTIPTTATGVIIIKVAEETIKVVK
ncbi:MAG: discoidin domain-containing protein [Bacteroidales bacterium]|nr:discoidin domain-containing protein [Bacteroidales bacterium]